MRRHQFDAREPMDSSSTAPIFRTSEMLSSQHLALRRILLRVYEIADREAAFEDMFQGEIYGKILNARAPRQVFFIDGARGAGKTTLLVTLQQLMRFLGRPDKVQGGLASALPPRALLHALDAEIRGAIANEKRQPSSADERPLVDLPNLDPATFSFFNAHKVGPLKRRSVHFLPVIFPSDLEQGQAVMEAVFALISNGLTREIARRQKKANADPEKLANEFAAFQAKARRLREKIFAEVAKGWYLSRRDGVDAILRDSADYIDFLSKMGEAGEAAHQRVTLWRDFVTEFLDLIGAQVLVLSFDDTDNTPQATAEILHTARVFLSHPRIVTLIAGNLRSMRQSLILSEMANLGAAVEALDNEASETARDWRRFARQQVEELIEKTLPRPNRSFISFRSPNRPMGRRGRTNDDDAIEDDFHRLFDMSFDAYCASMMNGARDEYFKAKHKASVRYLSGAIESQTPEERASLERFISWWLFRNRYGRALRPRTARHLIALRDLTLIDAKSPAFSHRLPFEHGKRLAVILFESPDNFDLLQRFSDGDADVVQWLHRQHVKTCWTGDRYIEINRRKIFEDSYSYQFMCFRVDLGIALPLRDNSESRVPAGLMPVPNGPNLNGLDPFFCRAPGVERYGMARSSAHSLIPHNCLYFFDAQSLPDIAWQGPSEPNAPSPWGGRLIYDWPQMFSFRAPPARTGGAATTTPPVDMSALQSYMVEVVFPFASLQLGKFAPAGSNLRDPKASMKSMARAHLLANEINNDFFAPIIEDIDRLRRQFDYLGQVSQNFLAQGPANDVASDVLRAWRELIMERLAPKDTRRNASKRDKLGLALKEHLVSYRWLLNDLRRGWHASRIFLNEVADSVALLDLAHTSPAGDEPSATWRDGFSRADTYEIPTRALLDWHLGRSKTLDRLISGWQKSSTTPARHTGDEWRAAPDEAATRADLRARLLNIAPRLATETQDQVELNHDDMRAVLKTSRTNIGPAPWPFIIDPSTASMRQDQTSTNDAVHGRLARSYALFLYALAPTLPAAIHAEAASLLNAHPSNKAAARAALADWRLRIERFLTFVQEYRAVCELTKLRLDIWQHLQKAEPALDALAADVRNPTDAGANLSIFPDFSFVSLGVRGLSAWGFKFPGATPIETVAPPTESLLSSTVNNLCEALNFVAMSELAIQDAAAKTPTPKRARANSAPRKTSAKATRRSTKKQPRRSRREP